MTSDEIGKVERSIRSLGPFFVPKIMMNLAKYYRHVCWQCVGFHDRLMTQQGAVKESVRRKCQENYNENIRNFPPTQRLIPRAENPDIVANLTAMDPTELLHLYKEGTLVPKPPKDMSKFIAWDQGLVGIDFLMDNRLG